MKFLHYLYKEVTKFVKCIFENTIYATNFDLI